MPHLHSNTSNSLAHCKNSRDFWACISALLSCGGMKHSWIHLKAYFTSCFGLMCVDYLHLIAFWRICNQLADSSAICFCMQVHACGLILCVIENGSWFQISHITTYLSFQHHLSSGSHSMSNFVQFPISFSRRICQIYQIFWLLLAGTEFERAAIWRHHWN